jgi:outer membrane receptor for monomeric catechols
MLLFKVFWVQLQIIVTKFRDKTNKTWINVTVKTDHIKTVVLTHEMLCISSVPQTMNSVLHKCDMMG